MLDASGRRASAASTVVAVALIWLLTVPGQPSVSRRRRRRGTVDRQSAVALLALSTRSTCAASIPCRLCALGTPRCPQFRVDPAAIEKRHVPSARGARSRDRVPAGNARGRYAILRYPRPSRRGRSDRCRLGSAACGNALEGLAPQDGQTARCARRWQGFAKETRVNRIIEINPSASSGPPEPATLPARQHSRNFSCDYSTAAESYRPSRNRLV